MIIISQFLIFCSLCYIIKVFLYPFFRSAGRKQKKKSYSIIKARKKAEFKNKVDKVKFAIIDKIGKYMMTNGRRIKYKKLLDRLDIYIMPEEIILKQFIYAIGAAIFTFLSFKFNQFFGYVSASLIFIMWMMPVDDLYKKVQQKDKNITNGFPGFYSMVYYQYAKSVNIFLGDVIRDYMPNANPDLAFELNVMLDNIEFGEEFALKQLKKRVPLHCIIKFCDIMQTRLNGYDNTSQMLYFKSEIDEQRLIALEKELEKRQRENERLQLVLIVLLGVYLVIYFSFMALEALNLFSM